MAIESFKKIQYVPSTLNTLSLNNWDDDAHSAPDFYSERRGDFVKSEKNSECDANDGSTTRDESKCDESLETVERRSDTNHHSNSKNLHSKKVKKRRSVDKATKGAKEGDHLKSKKAVGLETEVHKLRNRREHHTKTHSKTPKGRSAAKVLETSQEPTATCKDLTLSNPSLFENVPETSSPTFEQLVPPNSSPVEKVLGTNSLTSKQLAPPKPSPLEKASGKSSPTSKQLAPSKLSPFEKASKTGSPASKQLASSKPSSFEKASGTSSPTSKQLASSKPTSFEKTSGTNPKPSAINAKQSTQTPKQIAISQQCMTSPKTSFITPNQNGEADVLKSTEIVQILSKLSEEVLMKSNTNQSINIESKNASNVSINRHDKKHRHGHRKRKEKKRTRSHSDNRIREHRHHRKGGSKSSISSDRGALDIETKSLQSNGSIMSPVQKKADETIGLHSGRTTQRVDNRSNKSIQSVRGSPERFSVNSAEFGTNVNAGTQNPIPSLEEDAMSCSCKLHSRVPTATLTNQTAAMYSTVGKDENQSFKQLQNGYFILPGPVYVMQQALGTLPPPVVPYNPPGLKTIKVVPTIEQKAAEQNINANSIVQSKEKDKCIQTKPKKSVCLCPPRSLPKKKCDLKTCFAFKNSREDLLLSEEYDNEMPPSITQFFPTAATQTTSSEFIMISRILSVYAQNVQDTESESKSERQIKSTILDPSIRVISSTNEKQNKKRKTNTVSEVESSLKRAANELQALLSGKAIDNIAKLSTHIENISEVDEEAKDHLDRVVSLQSSTKLRCQIEMQKKRDLEELPEEEEGIQEPDVTKQPNVVVGTNVTKQPNVVVGSGVTKQPKVMMESDVTKQPNVVVGPDVTDDPIEISKSTPYAAQSLGNNREDTLIGSASIDLDDNISDDLGIKRVTRSVAERNTSRVFSSSKRVDESEGDDFMKKLDTVPARMSMTTSMEQRIKKVVHESEMFRHPEDKGAGWTNNVGGIDIVDISSSESSEEDEQQMWAQQDTEDPRGFHSKYSVHETPKMKRLEETTTVGAADSSSAGILEGKD